MITVNIELEEGTKAYDFPTSWDEVTVEQFINIYKINFENTNELMGVVKLLSAISGIEEETLMMIDIDDFKKLSTELSFFNKEMDDDVVEFIEINGEQYFLYKEFNKLTTGEIITIELLLEKAEQDLNSIIPDLLCLFLRKKKDDGTFEKFNTDMMNRRGLFLNIPINKIYHIFNFFLPGNDLFSNNIQVYTEKQT